MLEIMFRLIEKPNLEPNSIDIKDHMMYKTWPNRVLRLKSFEHFKVDTLSLKGAMLVQSTNVSTYNWVDIEVVGTPLCLSTQVVVDATNTVVDCPSV